MAVSLPIFTFLLLLQKSFCRGRCIFLRPADPFWRGDVCSNIGLNFAKNSILRVACGPPLRPIFSLLECCFAILLQMAWHSSSAFVLGSAWMALE